MPNESGSAEGRVEWLDSLRALAALWVVAHHAASPAAFARLGPLGVQFGRFLAHGTLAVTAFIALSGFSLGLGAKRRDWSLRAGYGEFLRARAIRILPPYLLAIVLSLAVVLVGRLIEGSGLSPEQGRTLGVAFLKHLFLLQDLDGTNLVDLPGWSNGVFWTIGVEFKIYLLFPLMLAAVRRGGLLAGAASAGALALLFGALPYLRVERKPGFIVVFFLGVIACAYAGRLPRPAAAVLSLLAAAVGIACVQTDPLAHQLPRDLAFGAGFCALMASVESLPRLRGVLDRPLLAGIGAFAYSLYLVHAVVLQTLQHAIDWSRFGDSPAVALAFLLVGGAASLLVARGFFLVAERPFFRVRHRTASR